MADFPEVDNNYFIETEGVIQVRKQLNNLKLIFRETPNKDVGIDAQIEHTNNAGEVTGKLVAVQIKSGASYLIDRGDHWAYYPSDKHRNYWEVFPLPVILMLYSPQHESTFFVDVRHVLRNPNYRYNYIAVPKCNKLESSNRDKLFETWGDLNLQFLGIEELLQEMVSTRHPNPTFSISYFELFSFGLVNISRQLFFNMSLAVELAELTNDTEYGLSIGDNEHEFLHSYVKFLLSQNLANVDYADFLIDWKERLLQPMFIAPLTNRGRQLLKLVSEKELFLFGNSELTRERLIGNIYTIYNFSRMQRAKAFASRL